MQVIYDAFVKVWRLGGWDGVTTRAIALEAGVSVGALYEYFPNRESVLSGYVRHCIDALIQAIEEQVIAPEGMAWGERIHHLVQLCCGMPSTRLPGINRDMLMLEPRIAEPKHHRRVYEELLAKWMQAFAACTDLPRQPDPELLKALFVSAWGGRRYLLVVEPEGFSSAGWIQQMECLVCAAVNQNLPEQGG
ncbi:MAG: TetR/AcrR family transcriptional regulator [Noviherbaspirillum sp.]